MPNNSTPHIFKQTWLYSISTQAAQAITLVAAILSRRFLGPTQTGIWTALQILVDYSKYSTLGTMDAVSREIPFLIGKGETQKAEATKDAAASFVLSGSLLFAACISLAALYTHGRYDKEITYGLFFIVIVILLQRFNNLLVALLRCFKRFEIESGLMIASAIINAILVGLLTYRFKIYGFIWALILSLSFNIVYTYQRYPFNFKWNLNRSLLTPLIQYGFPLMLLGLLTTLFRSLDRILIARYLGFESLGWYSTALMILSYLSNFPISIAIVLLPHFQERLGLTDSPTQMQGYLIKSTGTMALLMPMLLAGVWVFAPYAIKLFLPKFAPGIESMIILTLSLFFVSTAQLFYDALVNIKKHTLLFPVMIVSCLVSYSIIRLAIDQSLGITGVATATTAGSLVYFLIIFFTAINFFGSKKTWFIHLLKLSALFFYLLLFFFIQKPLQGMSLAHQITGLAAFCVPLMLRLERSTSFFTYLIQKISPPKNNAH